MANETTCENCHGNGYVHDLSGEPLTFKACPICGGTGRTTEQENNSILQEREVKAWAAFDEELDSRESDDDEH